MMTVPSTLSVRDLKVRYHSRGGVMQALSDVSFDVSQGEILALVGESGCGKSTVGHAIMGLLASPPAEICGGDVLLHDESLFAKPESEMRDIRGARIAMIFQEPMTALDPLMRIGDQLTEGLRHHRGVAKEKATARAAEALEIVRISDPAAVLEMYPHELSGGMQQRVMIAMALICDPQLLVADEPTTALDVTIQAQILSLLLHIRSETGIAIVLITHDLGVVASMADKVAVMYAGAIVEYAPVFELFNSPLHPYTRKLLEAVPRIPERAEAYGKDLAEIPGMVPVFEDVPDCCPFANRCGERIARCEVERPEKVYAGERKQHFATCWNVSSG